MSADNERYRNAFIANHSRLVRKLISSELVETLFARSLITVGEKEEIEAGKTDSSKINKCLNIFHRRYYGNPAIFKELFSVIEEINENEGGIIDHVIDALNESINNPPKFPSALSSLSEFDRARLQLYEATIVSTLDVCQLLPDLISEGVVTFQEATVFEEEGSFAKRGRILIELLKGKGSDVFQCFVEVLRESEVYEVLADDLSRSEEERDGGSQMDDREYGMYCDSNYKKV